MILKNMIRGKFKLISFLLKEILHSKGANTEFMIYDNVNEVIEELCQSFRSRYQTGLETSMRSSDFMFECVHLLY